MKRLVCFLVIATLIICSSAPAFATAVKIQPSADHQTSGVVTIDGTLTSNNAGWYLSFVDKYYDLTVSVPEGYALDYIVVDLSYMGRVPHVSAGEVELNPFDKCTLSIDFDLKENIRSVTLHGVDIDENGRHITEKDNRFQHVEGLVVLYEKVDGTLTASTVSKSSNIIVVAIATAVVFGVGGYLLGKKKRNA